MEKTHGQYRLTMLEIDKHSSISEIRNKAEEAIGQHLRIWIDAGRPNAGLLVEIATREGEKIDNNNL